LIRKFIDEEAEDNEEGSDEDLPVDKKDQYYDPADLIRKTNSSLVL
jgi:hypothetical protein